MTVTQFRRPQDEPPHATGDAICANCKNEWVAVAPAGTTRIECPKCNTHRAAFKYLFGPSDGELSFQCSCGSFDFFISKKHEKAIASVFCWGCGLSSTGWFE